MNKYTLEPYSGPIRQEVHWMPDSRQITLKEEPLRVWTWFCTEQKPEIPVELKHKQNSFEETHGAGWFWHSNGTLLYNSEVVDYGVWVVLEFEDE